MSTPTPAPAPFLRWAGGKRRLLPVITAAAPKTYATYYEPFLGGGAVHFALTTPQTPRVISDFNADLVSAYTALRDTPDELIAALHQHQADVSEEWFYQLRAATPTTPLEQAARFIAYNRTCFNGLFRVNSAGGWNVPYGKLKNPTVCNEPLLRAVHAHLKGATILTGTYQDAVETAGDGDFVYLDPPYLPLSATSSFSKYAAGDFTEADHRELAATIDDLTARGAKVMLSNADTPLARDIFAGLDIHTVTVTRSISADATARGAVTEILATNYTPEDMHEPDTIADLTT